MPEALVLPNGYEDLRKDCERLLADHPRFELNVFLMTRFSTGDRPLADLDEQLRKILCRAGLNALRADDGMYARDQQVWTNVCVFMLCCSYGVAILENRDRNEFNPNVALEYGFMRALNRPTLLLVDRSFHNLRADIVGTLHEPFDMADLSGTLETAVERWIGDRGFAVKAGPSELQQQALRAHRRLRRIQCARIVRDEARRQKEREDELWYFGEEIATYRKLLAARPDASHEALVEEAHRRVVIDHDGAAVSELADRFAALARG